MDADAAARITLVVGVLVLAAVAGVRGAARLGLPGLLFYLALGMLLSDEGIGGVAFDDAELATALGYAGLVIILAEGGLTTRPANVRPVILPAALLASVGVAVSIVLVAWPLHWITGLDLRTAVLVGAVLAPTDAAAVFTVARGLRLPPRLQTLLEAESGLNDAPVVVLVVLLSTASAGMPAWLIPIVVVAELVGGTVVGLLVGAGARWAMPRLALPASGLYPVAVIGWMLLAYGLAVAAHTSGFAAVYVLALMLAASPLPHRRVVLGFVEGLAWAVQIGLFIMLGLLVVPGRAVESLGVALLAGALLLLVARPVSVAVGLGPFLRPTRLARLSRTRPMPWQWAAFAAWAGLRGAVPIIFATIPLGALPGEGPLIFDVTMLIVVALTLLQSPTMPGLARRLGLVTDRAGELSVEAAPLDTVRAALLDLEVPGGSRIAGTYISELPLPRGAVVSLVVRGDHTLVPDRYTRVRVGDQLLIVVTERARAETEQVLRSVSRGGRLSGWTEQPSPEQPGQ